MLGVLLIALNLAGGFLPSDQIPGPIILQYIFIYALAIALCILMICYLYKDFDIKKIEPGATIRNLSLLIVSSFFLLFIIPYFITQSIKVARASFTVPIGLVLTAFSWLFYNQITIDSSSNRFKQNRTKLSLISVCSIALLPILTAIANYPWFTLSVINLAFYTITGIEVNHYHHFLEERSKFLENSTFRQKLRFDAINPTIFKKKLSPREFEVAIYILSKATYKAIGKELHIAESTVSKHASNIYKKAGVKNKQQFLLNFKKRNTPIFS